MDDPAPRGNGRSCPHCGQPSGSTLACLACGRILSEPENADHFGRLGLPLTQPFDLGVAEVAYLRLSRLLHPDFQTAADAATQRLALDNSALLNEAWRVLTDEQLRAEYRLELHDPGALERHKALSPAFLMEAMELSEELEEAQEVGCQDTIKRIAETARTAIEERLSDVDGACSSTMERIARESYAPHVPPEAMPARLVGDHEWNTEQMAVLLHQARVYRRILRDTETATR